MKYFMDCEFLEGTQKNWLGKDSKSTIDLISIGIVAEDGREYYAISKDFNLKEAWNRFDLVKDGFRDCGLTPNYKKVYWIRENVLKPIYEQLLQLDGLTRWESKKRIFNYDKFKFYINKYGKTNKQIAEEVKEFCLEVPRIQEHGNPQFYGYYCDYDWVVFCWLFGKMIDLPKGFSMYCIDLKQELDAAVSQMKIRKYTRGTIKHNKLKEGVDYTNTLGRDNMDAALHYVKAMAGYPKQTNEHSAIHDARWNKQLYEFLNTL